MASTDHRHHAAAASTHAVAKRALVETISNDTAVGADCPLEHDRIGQKRRPDPRRRHWPELVETSSRQPSARPAPRRLPLRLRDQPRPRHSTTLLVWTRRESYEPVEETADASGSSRRSGSAPQAEIRRARPSGRSVPYPVRTRSVAHASQRLQPKRHELVSNESAWQELEARGATMASVPFSGRADRGGRVDRMCSIESTGASWWMSSDGPPHVVVSAIAAYLADKLASPP